MNDNLPAVEGPRHAEAVALLNDLYLILRNMGVEGVDVIGADGEPVYQPAFWAGQCARVLGIKMM
jgi:hypothetical protein